MSFLDLTPQPPATPAHAEARAPRSKRRGRSTWS